MRVQPTTIFRPHVVPRDVDLFALPPEEFPTGTAPRVRAAPPRMRPAVVATTLAGVMLGVVLGIALAFRGGDMPVPASPVAASPAIVMPVRAAPIVRPATVTVRIESTPAGALATLIDRGQVVSLGSTPIDVELDPSRSYDVMVSLGGRVPQVAHVEPELTRRVVVELHHHHHHREQPAVDPAPELDMDPPPSRYTELDLADPSE